MHLSRCLGVHPEMRGEVPSRVGPFLSFENSLRPKLPELSELWRLVPWARRSFLRGLLEIPSLKKKEEGLEVPDDEVRD